MGLFASQHETIEGVGQALRAGRTTCVKVLEKCFDRIEEWEPCIQAWVHIAYLGAMEQARALDEELDAGKDRGPLHGIPIGIKDIINVKGLPTACGSRSSGPDAYWDAELVAHLRQAGAVIMGKTVTTQYAWIDPPVTRNPWNLERTPGGSSSGSAAAVALGMCLGAIGTQTGGSIIRPASFCGVCGLKPSFGRISTLGIMPFAPNLDHPGPIARTVRDLELIFEAITGLVMERLAEPAQSPPRPPILGRLRGIFDAKAEPVMRHAFEDALSLLSRAGASVNEAPWPEGFDEVLRCHRVIMAREVAFQHERRLAWNSDVYQPKIRALIEEGLATPTPEYVRCREHQDRLRWEMDDPFGEAEAFIVPATIGPAPDLSTTGDPVLNSPWSYTGLPTISFPFALSPDGLPLALQLVGQFYSEPELFRVALWCEDVLRAASRAKKD